MTKALFIDLLRCINRTKARFFSVIAIVALGVAFFTGLQATQPDMYHTGETYFNEHNLMDIRVLSTVGLTGEDIYQISSMPGVESFMRVCFVDGLVEMDGQGMVDIDGSAFSVRAISLDFNMANKFDRGREWDMAYINRLRLLDGRYPEAPNECVVSSSALSTPDEFVLGAKIGLKGDRENLNDVLNQTEFTVVGVIDAPTYISFERGNTLIGSGKLGDFIYVPWEAFSMPYYTEVYLKLEGTDEMDAYSQEYENHVERYIEQIEAISKGRVQLRAAALRAELEPKVADGRATLQAKTIEVEAQLKEGRELVEQVLYYAEHGDEELAARQAEFEGSLSAGQQELLKGKGDINAGWQEYYAKKAQYDKAKAVIDANPNAVALYNNAKLDLDKAASDIASGKKQIDTMEKTVLQTERLLLTFSNFSPMNVMVEQLENVGLDVSLLSEFRKMTAVGMTETLVEAVIPIMDDLKTQLNRQRLDLARNEALYSQKLAEWQAKAKDIEELQKLPQYERELDNAYNRLMQSQGTIDVGELMLQGKQLELKMELDKAQQKINEAKLAQPTAEADFAKAEEDAYAQLENARFALDKAENTLAGLNSARWMVTDRNALPGFSGYQENADGIRSFASILPIVFFTVAALICLTTMARMVEEERTQMGTLKALGYGSNAIVWKYLIYAIIASLGGTLLGSLIGFTALPFAITSAFGIMFDMPPVILGFYPVYALIGMAVAMVSTVGATIFACRKELGTNPAQLMRPKAPKAGKRVLVERISFFWNSLSFQMKVTMRNMFRNKRRAITTMVGIAGCAALLLASFGMRDSIGAIINAQYGDGGIAQFDVQFVFRDEQDPNASPILEKLNAEDRLGELMLTYMRVTDGGAVDSPRDLMEVNILVPQSAAQLSDFVRLENRKTKERQTLTDGGALITERFAEFCNADIGDELFVLNNDGEMVRFTVAGIVENYTFHYVYLTPVAYEAAFQEKPRFNAAYGKLADDIKLQSGKELAETKSQLATDLMRFVEINAVVYTTLVIDTFNNILNSISLVIVIFVVAAGALALAVLYTLANININERVREIATLKVLGFYDNEVSSYIYRENVFLTIAGIALGILAGGFLHGLMAAVINISVVMLGRDIYWPSYIYAIVLTVCLAMLVNMLMHKKLKTISMVESLKSTE